MDGLEGWMLAPTGVSVALYLTMCTAFVGTMRSRESAAPSRRVTPRVSILKPLAGVDDELLENLASFARLTYPNYEILLGVASADDPAYPVAREFIRQNPSVDAKLVVTDPDAAINPKVAQLLGLDRAATGAILVVSDSNVRVTPDYLDPVVGELSKPGVAVVSSVVAGTGEHSLGAALENFQLGSIIAPGVVAAAKVARRPITIGKSMAMWRSRLHMIGGFARVQNLLSEDHMLGRAFDEAGFKVALSTVPIDNRNVDCSLRRTIERHTRWAKIRRSITPFGFVFEPLLCPLVTATLTWAAFPSKGTAAMVLAIAVAQTAAAYSMLRLLRGSAPRWYWAPLEVVRSYLLFACWVRACLSLRVSWRGHDFELSRDSAIVPREPGFWGRARTMVGT
jgi:ceramide glucosyltransferase